MGFQDAFGKSGSGEGNLQYDDGAFFVFVFTTFFILFFITLYSLISQHNRKNLFKRNCLCKNCDLKKIKYL
jgi:hypothetical protein